MGLVRLPLVLERFDVVCYEAALGVQLSQLESGAVVVIAFQPAGPRGEPGPVQASGKVRVGDALVCVDEVPIELLKYEAVLDKLRDEERPLTLTFGRTEPTVAQQAKVRAEQHVTKARRQEERARLRELEAERAARSTLPRASAAQARAQERQRLTGGRKLYTANDFRVNGLRPLHQLFIGMFALLAMVSIGYIVDVDVFNLTLGTSTAVEQGTAETFHASGTDEASPTPLLRGADADDSDTPAVNAALAAGAVKLDGDESAVGSESSEEAPPRQASELASRKVPPTSAAELEANGDQDGLSEGIAGDSEAPRPNAAEDATLHGSDEEQQADSEPRAAVEAPTPAEEASPDDFSPSTASGQAPPESFEPTEVDTPAEDRFDALHSDPSGKVEPLELREPEMLETSAAPVEEEAGNDFAANATSVASDIGAEIVEVPADVVETQSAETAEPSPDDLEDLDLVEEREIDASGENSIGSMAGRSTPAERESPPVTTMGMWGANETLVLDEVDTPVDEAAVASLPESATAAKPEEPPMDSLPISAIPHDSDLSEYELAPP